AGRRPRPTPPPESVGRLRTEVEDALLLINHEQSRGHVAVLLEDVDCGLWVVLSSRRFRGRHRS
ncbi:MAG: hypothetical protein ACJ786_09265, partial [Catenulispora sp.]